MAGEIEPSADMQASHRSLILQLKLEGCSVILQPEAFWCYFSWPDLQELFYFGTCTGKTTSALEEQLRCCCVEGVLGARPPVSSLGRNTFKMLLSLLHFDPMIYILVPNTLNPLWWEIFQSRIFILKRGMAKTFSPKPPEIEKHRIKCALLPSPPLPTKQSKKAQPAERIQKSKPQTLGLFTFSKLSWEKKKKGLHFPLPPNIMQSW